jgi:CTP synthase (UTP-ammonia lyase)
VARLAIIADYDAQKTAHVAIPRALERARQVIGANVDWEWIDTDHVLDPAETLAGFSGVWVAPGSPYRNMDGALAAIRHAREQNIPFLGTCGGFQHALIEFARHVARITGADHAETNSLATDPVVTALGCSLVDQTGGITFTAGSRMHAIFGGRPTHEGYHCNYGVNLAYRARLEAAGLRFTGFDAANDIRAFELSGHRFFLGTLFQPERSALHGAGHPLVEAFVAAVRDQSILLAPAAAFLRNPAGLSRSDTA